MIKVTSYDEYSDRETYKYFRKYGLLAKLYVKICRVIGESVFIEKVVK